MMNQFDRSDILIHNMDPIQYHQDVEHPIEFIRIQILLSMGLHPELLLKKNIYIWKSIFSHLLLLHYLF